MVGTDESFQFTIRTGDFDLNFAQNGLIPYFGTPSTAAVANPVPVPAAAWLMVGGLGLLGALRKRAA
ncbi:hypothetical protein RGUI_2649 [Rhodovulum sp. P5]|uniref:hypothetical protein n=1 Tax=Rhodovulum sp. P5 TaxID=1564506 RepID=UPI0009C1C47C|nr:hypothetical protein [Rhodovulum sp. P5]ARE40790.1 hypothetical protein RGUI_2649 [Rhodovulum sp. P5]